MAGSSVVQIIVAELVVTFDIWIFEITGAVVSTLDGTAGIAGTAGVAGVAPPPPLEGGVVGVAGIAGTAGIAGVTSLPPAPLSPEDGVARTADVAGAGV